MVQITEKQVGPKKEWIKKFIFNENGDYYVLTSDEIDELKQKIGGGLSVIGPEVGVQCLRIGERLYLICKYVSKNGNEPFRLYLDKGELPSIPHLMEEEGFTRKQSMDGLQEICDMSCNEIIKFVQKNNLSTKNENGDAQKDENIVLDKSFYSEIVKNTVTGIKNRAILALLVGYMREERYNQSEVA